MPISDVAINQPVFITMLMLLAVVIGLLAYSSRPVELFPSISVPVVVVAVPYPGAGPESVADQVTRPLEETLNTMAGVDQITSTSSEGIAQIQVQFVESVDPNQAIQNVRERVSGVMPRLPSDVGDPTFFQFDLDSFPVLQAAIASDGSLSPLELRELIEDVFVPSLQRVEGVGDVQVNGGQVRQINVQLDLARLQAYQISPAQVIGALQQANANLGLGKITGADQSYTLRTPSQIRSIDDIARIRITRTPYRIGDVATISEGPAEVQGYARLNGQEAVTIGVVKRSGTNTAAVTDAAREELERLMAAHPNLSHTITLDQSEIVKQSVNSSIEEIILAVAAAFLVVLLFFRDLRNTLTTIAGLPIIMIFTFAAMALFGISINLLSLLALSLSVGLVIDDAIVVRENIFRYAEHGYSPRQAASKGTAQVTLSVVAMTLTIIAVFLPVALVSGTAGFIFKAFGITVASAMAISLVEAFTFAPMLSATLFKAKGHRAASQAAGQPAELDDSHESVGAMGRFYERILRWSLRHRGLTFLITVGVLALSIVAASGLKVEFLPAQQSDTFTIAFEAPPGTALPRTDELARRAEAVLLADPDIVTVQSQVGGQTSEESGSFTIRTRSGEVTDAVRERLRPQLDFLPGVIFSTQSAQGGGTSVTGRTVQIQVRSALPLREMAPVAQQIEQAAAGVEGLTDVGSTYQPGRPEVVFYLPPDRAGDLGITNSDVATTIRALITGATATTLRQPGSDTAIVVRLAEGQRADLDALRTISIPTASGNVPLTSVAEITIDSGPTSVRRTNLQNEIIIGANIAPGANQMLVLQQLQQAIGQLNVPDAITVSFGGTQEEQAEAFGSLFMAMGLSVLFVYMVLASQFGSFTQPLVIMLAMPFSFLGAFVALSLAGIALDVTALIGLIMLLGLVVKNSILLVDLTNKLREAGLEKHAALERAGAIRLRPILMTSLAIIAGALPTALGIHLFSGGEGSEFRRGLATVLIGGMLTSTLLTLLIVPTAYSALEGLVERVMRPFRRDEQEEPAAAPSETPAGGGADGQPDAVPAPASPAERA